MSSDGRHIDDLDTLRLGRAYKTSATPTDPYLAVIEVYRESHVS
jgi:hypothetical protein